MRERERGFCVHILSFLSVRGLSKSACIKKNTTTRVRFSTREIRRDSLSLSLSLFFDRTTNNPPIIEKKKKKRG